MKIAIARQFPLKKKKELMTHYEQVRVFDKSESPTSSELEVLAKDVDVLMVSLAEKITDDFLKKNPSIKLIVTYSTGVDHVDLKSLQSKGIALSYTPGVLANATAELALTLLFACARRLKPAVHFLEMGRFQGFDPLLFRGLELEGATLGIVGLGSIGNRVAKKASGMGMNVIYTRGKKANPEDPYQEVELGDLLKRSDVVSLHNRMTPENKHMISRKQLSLMKKEAVLINTARGPLVEEQALISHLKTHPEFYVGLDVYEHEPKISKELLALPNAVCLPHIGSATEKARLQMAKICAQEAIRFVKGEKLQYPYPLQ